VREYGVAITIRSAAKADADAWLRMRKALWPEDEGEEQHSAEIVQYFAGSIREPLEVLIAVGESAEPVGFAELSIRSHAEDCLTDRVAYLEGWYVEPSARRTGVGRALVGAAEEWARRQGCIEFGSDALIDNEVSAQAHRALGFEQTAEIRCFRKSLTTTEPGSHQPAAGASEPSTTSALSSQVAKSLSFHLERVRAKVHTIVDPLSTDQIWRKPYPYGNSIGHLLLHLTGNLSYYIGTQIAETGYVRDRPKEFADSSMPPKDQTLERFDRAVDMVLATLAAQHDADWSSPYHGVGSEDVRDRLGIFVRCISHVDHHAGQMIYLARELTQ